MEIIFYLVFMALRATLLYGFLDGVIPSGIGFLPALYITMLFDFTIFFFKGVSNGKGRSS